MKSPNANQVDDALRRLVSIAPKLRDSYRWAENLGLRKRAKDNGAQVHTSGVSDPTGDIVGDKAARQARDEVKTAGDLIMRGSAQFEGAMSALERAFRHMGPPGETPLAAYHDPAPRLVSRAEVEKATAAQGRRTARGDGYGES